MFYSLLIVNLKQIILVSMLITVAGIVYRVCIRFILNYGNINVDYQENRKKLLIIGVGEASRDLIKTIRSSMRETYNIIDDNELKRNYLLSGTRVIGDRYDIQRICKEHYVDMIFFSIANVDNKYKRDILRICQETNAKKEDNENVNVKKGRKK